MARRAWNRPTTYREHSEVTNMFNKKPSKPQNRIDSLIGSGTKIEGNITFSGGLRIDGEVLGNVTAASHDQPSTLVVSEHSQITGDIQVSHLVVNGTVNG